MSDANLNRWGAATTLSVDDEKNASDYGENQSYDGKRKGEAEFSERVAFVIVIPLHAKNDDSDDPANSGDKADDKDSHLSLSVALARAAEHEETEHKHGQVHTHKTENSESLEGRVIFWARSVQLCTTIVCFVTGPPDSESKATGGDVAPGRGAEGDPVQDIGDHQYDETDFHHHRGTHEPVFHSHGAFFPSSPPSSKENLSLVSPRHLWTADTSCVTGTRSRNWVQV